MQRHPANFRLCAESACYRPFIGLLRDPLASYGAETPEKIAETVDLPHMLVTMHIFVDATRNR